MEIINQLTAVIKPKKIFTEMLRSINTIPTSFRSFKNDCNIILIPDFDTQDDAIDYIRKNYQTILRNELKEWLGDNETDKFLVNVGYSLFRMWFDVEIHQTDSNAMENDLVDAPDRYQDEACVTNTDADIITDHIPISDGKSQDEEEHLYLNITLPYSECAYYANQDDSELKLFD